MEKNDKSPIRMTREGLERAFEELADVSIEPEAIERLRQRLIVTQQGLRELGSLIEPELEPFTIIALEDRSSESQ